MAGIIKFFLNISEQVFPGKETIHQIQDLALLQKLSDAIIKNIPQEYALKALTKELRGNLHFDDVSLYLISLDKKYMVFQDFTATTADNKQL